MLTEADDFFCHQIVEPQTRVLHNDPSWGERAFFTVSDPERFALDVGLSQYPNDDTAESYAVLALPDHRQVSMRASRDLSAGRWPPSAGPVRMEVLEPLRRWRLICEHNDSGLTFDLEYTARGDAYETRSPRIRRRHRLVYENVFAFQPGRYDGEIRCDGEIIAVDGIAGNRDRSWGIRASGEGRFRRGLVVTMFAEFEDVSLLSVIHERHDGTPVRRSGAATFEGGSPVRVVEFEHDLRFDPDIRQLVHGSIHLWDAEGRSWNVEAEPRFRLFLAGGGYTSDEHRRGRLGVPFWTERWNTSDPALIRRVDNLNDNVCRMRCGDREGHGLVETMLGEHSRYRVAPLDA